MSDYRATLRGMRFVIRELIGSALICTLPAYGDSNPEQIDAVQEDAAKLVLVPRGFADARSEGLESVFSFLSIFSG